MITPEELLRDRYKVIADFPGCSYEVGTILYVDPDGELYSPIAGYARSVNKVMQCDVDKYTANIQPLPWYAEREPGDVEGLYIKCKNGEVGQIKKHYTTDECKEPYPYFKFDLKDEIGHYYWNMKPKIISLEEYEAYQQSKKSK